LNRVSHVVRLGVYVAATPPAWRAFGMWSTSGHEVAFGARDPAQVKVAAPVRESGPTARAASVPEAAREAAVDAGHFALDTAADEIGQLVRNFTK
jgi:hypothetical protein